MSKCNQSNSIWTSSQVFSLYYALPEERENDCNAFDLSVRMKKEHGGRIHHYPSCVHATLKFGVRKIYLFIYFEEINNSIHQGCIKFNTSDCKDIYNVQLHYSFELSSSKNTEKENAAVSTKIWSMKNFTMLLFFIVFFFLQINGALVSSRYFFFLRNIKNLGDPKLFL